MNKTKIFVLGNSHSGKTPLANQIASTFGLPIISAGQWAKDHVRDSEFQSMEEYIKEITLYSVERLRTDFDASLDYICTNNNLEVPCVIDGERNPYDFVQLFSCKSDLAITIINRQSNSPATEYETGLGVISSYLNWLLINKFIHPIQHRTYSFDCLYAQQRKHPSWKSLEEGIANIVNEIRNECGDLLGLQY